MHSKGYVVHYARLRSDSVRIPDNGHNGGYNCTVNACGDEVRALHHIRRGRRRTAGTRSLPVS